MTRNNKGNALFLILIAVALFAALAYAVTQSGRGGSTVSREQAVLQVAQVLQYINELQTAMTKLQLLNGCTKEQINFYVPGWISNGFSADNSAAPTDDSCDIFSSSGAGATLQINPPAGVYQNDPPGGNAWNSSYWIQRMYYDLDGDAAHCEDVTITLWDVTPEFCRAFNRQMNPSWTTIPVLPTSGGSVYDYSAVDCGASVIAGAGGSTAYCAEGSDDLGHYFTRYLIIANPGH